MAALGSKKRLLDVQEPVHIQILDPSKADSFELNERFGKSSKKGKKKTKNKRKTKKTKENTNA